MLTARTAISFRKRTLPLTASVLSLALVTLLAPAESQAQEHERRTGPIMANLKIGPAIGFGAFSTAFFAIEIDAGYAVWESPSGAAAYATFAPQFEFGSSTFIGLPVGVQGDIPLPVKNLYVTPRFELGYGGGFWTGGSMHGLTMQFSAGAKYIAGDGQFNLGFEPLGFPILFATGGPHAQYRLFFYGGINF